MEQHSNPRGKSLTYRETLLLFCGAKPLRGCLGSALPLSGKSGDLLLTPGGGAAFKPQIASCLFSAVAVMPIGVMACLLSACSPMAWRVPGSPVLGVPCWRPGESVAETPDRCRESAVKVPWKIREICVQ